MSHPIAHQPMVGRSAAVLLLGVALCVLAFPRSCDAAEPAATCAEVASVELRDGEGATQVLSHWRCAGEDQVDICPGHSNRRAQCVPDICGPAGITLPGEPEAQRYWDGWLEPPIALPRPDGSQQALLVRRMGNGGYPLVVRYSLAHGRVQCEDVAELGVALRTAAGRLDPGLSFGFRGGRIEVIGDRLVLTKGVYLEEDPNCCPSQGFARLWIRLDDDRRGPTLERVERVQVPDRSKS